MELLCEQVGNALVIRNVAGVVVSQLSAMADETTKLKAYAAYMQSLSSLRSPVDAKAIPVMQDCIFYPKDYTTLLPMGTHPGAFGVTRKHHIHEGVDIYTEEGAPVYSMCEGTVIGVYPFTGKLVNQPHWADTFCVMVDTLYGVLNYGEILPAESIRVGSKLSRGDVIGNVIPVLLKDKGRPRHMLHMERYVTGTTQYVPAWELGTDKPAQLLDPTLLLMHAMMAH